eukprot:sb/3469019/
MARRSRSAPSSRSHGIISGKLYSFCTRELAMAANKRADMKLTSTLSTLDTQREYCTRVYKLNRLQLTRELLAMEKNSKQCRETDFNPDKFPSGLLREERRTKKKAVTAPENVPISAPAMLYGEEPAQFVREVRLPSISPDPSQISLRYHSDQNPLITQLRAIKDDYCSIEPVPFAKKPVKMDRFVHEFEWLDTKHTEWFMEKTIKLYHRNLMYKMGGDTQVWSNSGNNNRPIRSCPAKVKL